MGFLHKNCRCSFFCPFLCFRKSRLHKPRHALKASADVWWVIIGAVIALIVLIVLLVSFTARTQTASQSLSSCEDKGGICFASQDPCPRGTLKTTAFSCPQEGKCCYGLAQECLNDQQCQENGESKRCLASLISEKRYCE